MDVGVRELRDSLSRHLAAVQSGHTLTVTDHGKPIARIMPIGMTRLEQLRSEGLIQPARARKQSAPDPVKANGIVSDLIEDQRG